MQWHRFQPYYETGNYTFISNNGSSIVDYVIVSQDLIQSGIISGFNLGDVFTSDHLPLCYTLSNIETIDNYIDNETIDSCQNTTLNKLKWNNSRIEFYKEKWCTEDIVNNVLEIQTNIIEGNIEASVLQVRVVLESIFGLKPFHGTSIKHRQDNSNNWYDKDCHNFKRSVSRAYCDYRATGSTYFRHIYCDIKRQYKNMIKTKKRDFFLKQTKDLLRASRHNDSKIFWSFFKRKGSVTNCISSNDWYSHYSTQFHTDDAHSFSELDNYPTGNNSQLDLTILNNNIDFDETYSAISSLKCGKVCGIDGISTESIKFSSPNFIKTIHLLFEKCFASGYFPIVWQTGIIQPIFKSGAKDNPANYRPITILCILNKVFTKILNNRLTQ